MPNLSVWMFPSSSRRALGLFLIALCLISASSHSHHQLCHTSSEAQRIASIFVSALLINDYKGHDSTGCPSDHLLLQKMAADDSARSVGSEGMTFINIGFNKGFNLATWLNIYYPRSGVSNVVWFAAMQKWAAANNVPLSNPKCGVCDDCLEQVPINVPAAAGGAAGGLVDSMTFIGVDLNLANIELVRGVAGALDATQEHSLPGVSIKLLHAAGGAQSATIRIPKCPMGWEICRIPDNATSLSDAEWVKATGGLEPIHVPVVTVDEIVRNLTHSWYNMQQYHDTANATYFHGLVDILMIDTEGHDALVLKGAGHLIRRRAVRCIIFEYHAMAPWSTMRLEDSVRELDLHGYSCFFQGRERLWPLTGLCWSGQYEFHSWSNVMCVERNDVWMASIRPFIVTEEYINEILKGGAGYEGHTIKIKPSPSLPMLDTRQIYLVKNGTKCPFWSAGAFVSRGFEWSDTQLVDGGYAAFLADGDWLK